MPTRTTTTTVRVTNAKPKRRLVKRVRKVVIRTVWVKGNRGVVGRKAGVLTVKPAKVIEAVSAVVRNLGHKPVSELTVEERKRLPHSRR
jgi:hypothetical protein